MSTDASLNPRQARFVEEYLVDLNATQAAIRAGYSRRTAYSQGQALLKKHEIKAAVRKGQTQRSERTEITQDRALQEIARLALSDVTALFGERGRLKPMEDWSEDARAAVASVEVVRRNVTSGDGHTDDVIKLRLWDKSKNLELLAKHLGLIKERTDVRMPELEGILEKLAAGRRRLQKA